MADYTKHLRLIKPGGNDYYNIDDFNQNSELIDKETEKLNNAVTEIKNGATREKAGIVQYGTTEGKALEGMMLARMFGCVGYGGDIQEAGVKDVNYIYYDRNTRKMYKCLNQNSDVSANVANFIPLDNNSLLDRLENLNTKPNGDIASVTSFRLGFNTSNVLNTSKIKDKKIVYVTVRSDNMHISTQLPKNISRAMLVHGTNARTAIISIEETGFFLYGDITGITGIFLSEYVYA
ncbi:hypothetical protein [Fusobacterium periodonticum]|uniref:Uncharacterized protein n=1 Tax=Fusobacterium periodonticum ATCC 33693 TaxID=546275 RepID=D4CX44_9FUSO|nr:hypothetical protein [Fusobacterium periodonticum]EFE85964.1 hypothetical protein FUSPEROL_02004 [Fusobacterium periodonticum ATCC 33693]